MTPGSRSRVRVPRTKGPSLGARGRPLPGAGLRPPESGCVRGSGTASLGAELHSPVLDCIRGARLCPREPGSIPGTRLQPGE